MSACLANGLAVVIGSILTIIWWVFVVAFIVNITGADPSNRLVQMVNSIVEPICRPFRKLTRNWGGPLDWSFLIVIMIILFLKAAVVQPLANMGRLCG